MKTTLEITEATFRRAKMAAVASGITLKQLVTEAIEEKLRKSGSVADRRKPWMKGFGGLRSLKAENVRIMKIVEEEFERIDPEDRS